MVRKFVFAQGPILWVTLASDHADDCMITKKAFVLVKRSNLLLVVIMREQQCIFITDLIICCYWIHHIFLIRVRLLSMPYLLVGYFKHQQLVAMLGNKQSEALNC